MRKIVSALLVAVLLLSCSACALAETGDLRIRNGNYHGNLRDGKANGYGVWDGDEGARYFGMFVDNTFTGFGIHLPGEKSNILLEGGIFDRGSANFTGAVLAKTGVHYEGTWENNKWAIKGATSKSYAWINITFEDGTKYMGEALEETQIPHGYGILTKLDGSRFVGMFQNGLVNGTGIQVKADYSYILGEWENGMLVTTEEGPDE